MADSFKREPSVKVEVKDEPGLSPMTPFEDDDLYEDAGDLSFYDPNGPEDYNNVSLMRVSHDLWNRWSEINDDQEIQIGTMRVWEEPVKVGNQVKNVVSVHELVVIAPNNHQLTIFRARRPGGSCFSTPDSPSTRKSPESTTLVPTTPPTLLVVSLSSRKRICRDSKRNQRTLGCRCPS